MTIERRRHSKIFKDFEGEAGEGTKGGHDKFVHNDRLRTVHDDMDDIQTVKIDIQ